MSTTVTLTIKQIITLANAFNALSGYQQVVEENGKKASILTPYNISPKARWNTAKNLRVLQDEIEVHKASVNVFRKHVADFQGQQDKNADAKENASAVKAKIEEANVEIRKLEAEPHEVKGLLRIPADGLNLKQCPIPPEVIAELLPFIDGEPHFDDPPPAK